MSMTVVSSNVGNVAVVENPFAQNGIVNAGGGRIADTQVATKELSEVQARVVLAKNFPRDPIAACQKILTACQRVGLAKNAIYTYQRGGTDISGPTIRLAEEIVRSWGNIECGWQELERNDRSATIRAYAWDQETNALKEIVFAVPLQRTKNDRRGGKITVTLTDERDIYEHLANNAARRMRNCILALIPGDVIDAAVEQCHKTLVTRCDITPERIQKMLEAFRALGVSKAQIEKRIQRNIQSIAPAQFVRLQEIHNSIRDGMSEPSDWFEADVPEKAPTAADSLKAVLQKKQQKQQLQFPESTPEPKPEPKKEAQAPTDKAVEEPKPEPEYATLDGPEPSVYDQFVQIIQRTRVVSRLKGLLENIKVEVGTGEITDQQFAELASMIDQRSIELTAKKQQ